VTQEAVSPIAHPHSLSHLAKGRPGTGLKQPAPPDRGLLSFFALFTGPDFCRAAFSQAERFPLFFSRLQAFSAFASFCAFVRVLTCLQPVTLIFVESLIFAPFGLRILLAVGHNRAAVAPELTMPSQIWTR
jgi:hypothetical protein